MRFCMSNDLGEQAINNHFQVAAFYSFSPIKEGIISSLIEELKTLAKQYDVRGMILIALEGINGTICGPSKGVTAINQKLKSMNLENPFEIKFSSTSKHAFRRFKACRKKRNCYDGSSER